jgi:hypothetical protein
MKHVYDAEDNKKSCEEPGIYPATIIDAKDSVSKVKEDGSGGNDMIEMLWRLDTGHEFKDYLVDSPKLGKKKDSFLQAIGWPNLEKNKDVEFYAADVIGKRAFLDVGVETDSYGTKNKVRFYVTNQGVPPPLEEDKIPMGKEEKKADKDIDNLPF